MKLKDLSAPGKIVWGRKWAIMCSTLIGVPCFLTFKNELYNGSSIFSAATERVCDTVNFIVYAMLPGAYSDISFVVENRSLNYQLSTKLLFLSFTACYLSTFFTIIIDVIRQTRAEPVNASPLYSDASFIFTYVAFYLAFDVFRNPGQQAGSFLLNYSDQDGIYFLRTSIGLAIGLFSASSIVANITIFALVQLKKLKLSQHLG